MTQVQQLAAGVAARVESQPGLDDFLAWTAGTLEYWIHILASSVGKQLGWASNTEVPYVTAAPNEGTKSNTKWADGAMLLNDVGVLLEVKTIAAREGVAGPTLSKVPFDLAALVALDWPATLRQREDAYSGAIWSKMRGEMRRVFALQLVLVHGPAGQLPDVASIVEQIQRHALKVQMRLTAGGLADLGAKLLTTYQHDPEFWRLGGTNCEGLLLAWVVPLTEP